MKRSEIISRYSKELAAELVECYRSVLECDGRIQYKIYVWEDGEIEHLQGVQGDNCWLQPRDAEPRKLYYVWTIDAPYFDYLDYMDHDAADDENTRESEREEVIDYLVGEYETRVSDVLDAIIDEATMEERYE